MNNLYIGPMFEIERAHARVVSVVFLVEVYSAGIPALYPFCFVFLVATYMTHKFLCLKFY